MSTYLPAKAALLTLIRAYAGGSVFGTNNSSRDDFQVRDSPAGIACVVATAEDSLESDRIDGGALLGYGVQGEYQERHTFVAHVFTTVGTGETGLDRIVTTLETLVEDIKDYLRPFHRLNGTPGVRDAKIVRTTRPGIPVDRPQAYLMSIVVQVECEANLPSGESGG